MPIKSDDVPYQESSSTMANKFEPKICPPKIFYVSLNELDAFQKENFLTMILITIGATAIGCGVTLLSTEFKIGAIIIFFGILILIFGLVIYLVLISTKVKDWKENAIPISEFFITYMSSTGGQITPLSEKISSEKK